MWPEFSNAAPASTAVLTVASYQRGELAIAAGARLRQGNAPGRGDVLAFLRRLRLLRFWLGGRSGGFRFPGFHWHVHGDRFRPPGFAHRQALLVGDEDLPALRW